MDNANSNSKVKYCFCIIPVILFAAIYSFITGCSQKKPSDTYEPKILVLDDCDGDNDPRTPPDGDELLMLDSKGKLLKKFSGFQVKEDFGGNKVISISEDGSFFAVCEAAAKKLSIYETSTGKEYWSQTWPDKAVNSAVFFNNTLYAFNKGLVLAIDLNNRNIKEIEKLLDGTWLDLAFDKKNNCLWAAGLTIRKYDLNFKSLLQVGSIFDKSTAGVFSVDVTSDGSVWAAVKEILEKNNLENKLMKISTDGNVVKTINLDIIPSCICVDQSDDSIWVTGITSRKDYSKIGDEWPETLTELNEAIKTDIRTYTHKYNSNGDRIIKLDKGGYSIVLDPSDKSVWIACHESIVHVSVTGDVIDEYKDVSKQHKWIALVK